MGNDITTTDAPRRPTAAELLRDAPWKTLSARLTRYAFACIRHRSWHDAEDIAQEAITQAFDPDYQNWDPVACPDLFVFLKRLVKGVASNRRQKRMSHKEVYMGGVELPSPPPQDALAEEERGHAVLLEVRQRAAKDELVLKVLGLLEAKVETTREHAEHIGCTMDEARSARRRLGYLLKKIQAELDAQAGGDQ